MTGGTKPIVGALVGLIVSLLLVGYVSGTLIRHLIQITPAVLALVLVIRRVQWAEYAALSVLVFWFLLVIAIWLFLLGIASIVSGTFAPVEIVLTLTIGACSLWGIVGVLRARRAGIVARVTAFLLFAALQIGALWVSLRPAVAHI